MGKKVKITFEEFKIGEIKVLVNSLEVLKELLAFKGYEDIKLQLEQLILDAEAEREVLIKEEAYINKELEERLENQKVAKKEETKEMKIRYDNLQEEISSQYDDRYKEFRNKTISTLEEYKEKAFNIIKNAEIEKIEETE